MKKLIASTMLAATIAGGGLAVAAAAPAGAQAPAPTEQAARHHRHHLRHRALRSAVKTSADALGMKPKDLVAQLKAGKSVADVAEAKGVDLQKVKDALVAKGNAVIDKAVAAGKLDATKATKAKARLPKAVDRFVNHHKGDPRPTAPRGN